MELDATVGGPAANSYVSVEEATDLLEGRLNTEPWFVWDPESDYFTLEQRRESALMWATQLIDEQVQWYGTPSTQTQALAWPMTGMVDKWGRPVPTSIVPEDLKRATAYYALALMRDTSESPNGASSASEAGIKSKKIGDLTITYQDVSTQQKTTTTSSTGMPVEVRRILQGYGGLAGGINVPLKRV
jgi:hypothetical protein